MSDRLKGGGMNTQKVSDFKQSRPIGRRYPREQIIGYSIDIADGQFFARGAIEDISLNGFKIAMPSDSFKADQFKYKTVFSGHGKHFKLLVKPCWKKTCGQQSEIGFKIVDAPWEWAEFAMAIIHRDGNQDWVGQA